MLKHLVTLTLTRAYDKVSDINLLKTKENIRLLLHDDRSPTQLTCPHVQSPLLPNIFTGLIVTLKIRVLSCQRLKILL